jgi:streptomycin 6-kinase
MMQERLGRPLADTGLPVEAQIEVIAATLRAGWRPVPADLRVRTGAEQADWLSEFIQSNWITLGRPCSPLTVERAIEYTRQRRAAFDADHAVLIHGDAHSHNLLEDPSGTAPKGFKLIDPDAMASEPAHDLAIPLRDWTDELLGSDSADPAEVGVAWCTLTSAIAGVDRRAIWQWAFIERVSTGLFMTQLHDADGLRLLEVADAWAGVEL